MKEVEIRAMLSTKIITEYTKDDEKVIQEKIIKKLVTFNGF